MKSPLLFYLASLALAKKQDHFDCIIIGAGWAGMTAARNLIDAGQENILVLEARDRIGGRTWTSYEFGEDIPVDMGSISLDSTDTHPLFQIINATTITPKDQIASPVVISSNGTIFDDDFYNAKLKQYWEEFYGPTDGFEDNRDELYNASFHMENYNAAWENIDQFDDDMYYTQYFLEDGNLQDFIELFIAERGIPEGEEDLGFFMMLVERWITSEYAGSTSDMSELFWEEDSWYKGPSYFINMKMNMRQRVKNPPKKLTIGSGGWKLLVDEWAKPILDKIQMNSKVTHIDYESEPVLVTYEGSDGSNTTLTANTVVVTIPVGVLKAGDVEFFPALNDDGNYRENATEWIKKDYALDKIGPGKIIHVALYWEGMTDDEVFWPDNDWIQFIATEIESQGRLTQWLNVYRINGGTPILMGTVNGNHVDDMANMTDQEVVDEAVEKLRSIFGDDVPSPTQFIVKNWLNDEFAKGAYSYDRPDAFYPRWYLGKSLPGRRAPENRLIFAGEATSESSFGTTHGAIFEGQRAAVEVLENLLFQEDSEGFTDLIETIFETFNDLLSAVTELISLITSLFSTEDVRK